MGGDLTGSMECAKIPGSAEELCVGDMIRITPSYSGYNYSYPFGHSYDVDIVWEGVSPEVDNEGQPFLLGIVLAIYEGYPPVGTPGLTDADVYEYSSESYWDWYYASSYDYYDGSEGSRYLSEKYRSRFKWVKLWCVRGDKGTRLIEVDLTKIKVRPGE